MSATRRSPGATPRAGKLRERKPLAGQRILITRAAGQATEFSAKLRGLGARVISIPSIEIRPPKSYRALDQAIAKLALYDWLILTSVNGVHAFFARYEKAGLHATRQGAPLGGLKIAAIGPATRDAIRKNGFKVTVVPQAYVAEGVVKALRGQVKGKRVLLVRAKIARDVIPEGLRKTGAVVDVIEAYETVAPAKSGARLRRILNDPGLRPTAITFTSSSTVKNFVHWLQPARQKTGRPKYAAESGESLRRRLSGIHLASIGPVTSATLVEVGLAAGIEARTYTMSGLTEALTRHLSGGPARISRG